MYILCSCINAIYLMPAVAVGDNMFPLIEREFPFIYVSPSTIRRLRQKQLQQVTALTRPKIGQKPATVKKMAEVEQKQKALLQIIKKELDHTKRLVSETGIQNPYFISILRVTSTVAVSETKKLVIISCYGPVSPCMC